MFVEESSEVSSPGLSQVLTVTQVNHRAKQMLERQFGSVLVGGELSNVKLDSSGHCWFCLKDNSSVLNVVMFRRDVAALRFTIKNGLQVIANGRLTVYGATGRYQLVASRLEPQGLGALQASFNELKERLQQEGLFDKARKRPLPWVPRCVAVITSLTGAVIRDIIHVSTRRFGNAHLLMVPTRVQGPECAQQVANAIARVGQLSAQLHIDVLVIARGGGSLEDLWGFNSAEVAYAIAACPIPVVSAVGHETDFTIADFVADCRAPTPSAAAELVFAQKSDLMMRLHQTVDRAGRAVKRLLERQRYGLRALVAELGDGRAPILLQSQRLADLQTRVQQAMARRLDAQQRQLLRLDNRLQQAHPSNRLQRLRQRLQALHNRVLRQGHIHLAQHRAYMESVAQRLHALSPMAVLGRGYSIVLTNEQKVLRSADDVQVGDVLQVRLHRGVLQVHVDKLYP